MSGHKNNINFQIKNSHTEIYMGGVVANSYKIIEINNYLYFTISLPYINDEEIYINCLDTDINTRFFIFHLCCKLLLKIGITKLIGF